jgi:2-polyprenyl-3-methyl-5-hydroxy-6-metoxy-1,4-benzoquinol methylase
LEFIRRARFTLRHPLAVARYLLTKDGSFVQAERILDVSRAAKLKPGTATELDDLSHYLGLSKRITALNMARGRQMAAERWRQANPQTSQEVREFYQNCSEYLYSLANWNMMDPEFKRLLVLTDDERGGICLSFGGGIGSEVLKLAAQGNQVFYVDVSNSPVWKFAQWRALQRNVTVNFSDDVPKGVQFDCITAWDVFEHLTEEQLAVILGKLSRALKPGGRLYCRNEFEISAPYPMHYNHQALWDSLISQLPLIKVNESLYVKQSPSVGNDIQ